MALSCIVYVLAMPNTEPAKHGRFKRRCTGKRLFSIFEPRSSNTDNLRGGIDGDGGNKLGARDEVAMDAREDPTLGDPGKPRDE